MANFLFYPIEAPRPRPTPGRQTTRNGCEGQGPTNRQARNPKYSARSISRKLKKEVPSHLDRIHAKLNTLSHRIHANPELGFEADKLPAAELARSAHRC